VDPGSFQLFADPALIPGTGPLDDLAARAFFDGVDPAGNARWRLFLDPRAQGLPAVGNSKLVARLAGADPTRPAETEHTLEVETSYSADIQPIWTRRCTGCHEKPQLEKGLELVGPAPSRTHRNIVYVYAAEPAIDSVAPLLIRPYRPEESYLLRKLEGVFLGPPVLGSGDRMPRDGPPYLAEDDLRRIRDWVLQGARNN
jgi:hypothetical protein